MRVRFEVHLRASMFGPPNASRHLRSFPALSNGFLAILYRSTCLTRPCCVDSRSSRVTHVQLTRANARRTHFRPLTSVECWKEQARVSN